MAAKVFRTPNVILTGQGAAADVGAEAKKLASGPALIITDEAVHKAGLVDQVREPLIRAGFSVDVFDRVEPEPSIATVEKALEILRRGGHSIVIGVGGGSLMDVAKSAAAVAPLQSGVRDYLGVDRLPKKGLPRILVATTSGTGSEVTQVALLSDEQTGVKQKIASLWMLADVAAVDPRLCLTCPGL
jgi:alcohol dehydrogenase